MKTTECLVCKTKIEYKTKKPKVCRKCREANRRRKPRSKEIRMFRALDEVFSGQYYIRNGYYSFLLSPKKAPMQLDIYYPDLKLAFEYDGSQHSQYNEYFFRNQQQFKYLQRCDALKDRLCKELGITLIRITHKNKITPQLIIKKILETDRTDLIEILRKHHRAEADTHVVRAEGRKVISEHHRLLDKLKDY